MEKRKIKYDSQKIKEIYFTRKIKLENVFFKKIILSELEKKLCRLIIRYRFVLK